MRQSEDVLGDPKMVNSYAPKKSNLPRIEELAITAFSETVEKCPAPRNIFYLRKGGIKNPGGSPFEESKLGVIKNLESVQREMV